MTSTVLIFTKSVLPRSNTFVATQGNNLRKFTPIYIGLRNDTTGSSLVAGRSTCVQENNETFPFLSRLLLDGRQYLSPRWEKALAGYSANLIHGHFGKGGYYCTPISKRLDIPLITTFHGSDITQKDKFSYGKKHREIVFKQSSKILAVSNFIAQKLLVAGCPEEKIVRHYNGIDTDFFSPTGMKSKRPSILFVGRLIKQKGCQYLLQAMKMIHLQLPDAELVIAGDGSYAKTLKDLAVDCKNVRFVGAKNTHQVKELMDNAWLTCMPSIKMERGNEEGMGTVSIETQSMGTPLVGFDTGGVSEGVNHGVTGLLSREKDVAQLADNLLTLLKSDVLREQFAQAGIEHARSNFSIKTQCGILEDIYSSVE